MNTEKKFEQITKANIAKCHGCDAQCELGITQLRGRKILPRIGNCTIETYIDENGQTIDRGTQITFDPNYAIKRAREIAKLCDHYQQAPQNTIDPEDFTKKYVKTIQETFVNISIEEIKKMIQQKIFVNTSIEEIKKIIQQKVEEALDKKIKEKTR